MSKVILIQFGDGSKELVAMRPDTPSHLAVERVQRDYRSVYGSLRSDACEWRVLESTDLVSAMIESADS